MKSQFNKILLLSVLFLIQPGLAINIRSIKDTYTILKPEYKQLSPAHGPVWWEKNIVRTMYTYGLVGNDPGARIKDGVAYPNFPYGTIQLTRLLFHEVMGSFNLTRSAGNPASYLTPRILGRLMGMIENTRAEIHHKAKSQKNVNDMQEALNARLDQFIAKELAGNGAYAAGIEKVYKSITRAKPSLPEFKSVIEKRLVSAIVASLEESGFFELPEAKGKQKTQPYYPPFTTYSILLTFLYRKAEDIQGGVSVGKADFKAYFEGLMETIDNYILTQQGQKLFESEAWLADVYADSEIAIEAYLAEVRAVLEHVPEHDEKTKYPVSLLDQLYEKMVFAELSRPKGLPDLAEYRTSFFEGQKFSDCMDTTMRNAANIASFDNKTNSFALTRVPDAHPSQAFAAYYAHPIFKKASEIENPDAHNAWNVVIQNRDYIAYERVFDLKNPELKAVVGEQADTFQGFMRAIDALRQHAAGIKMNIRFSDGSMHAFDAVDINGKKFVLIDPAQYAAYEVEPSLQNIIVLMNDLFGFELYADINKAFLHAGFNATYFPLLAQKLGWEYVAPAMDLDKADYSKEGIKFSIQTHGGLVELEVRWGHGRFGVQSGSLLDSVAQNVFNDIRANLVLHCFYKQLFVRDSFILNLFALYQYDDAYGFEAMIDGLKECRSLRNFALYTQRLQDPNMKLRVIRELVNMKDSEMYDMCAIFIKNLPVQGDLFYLKALSKIDFSNVVGNKGQNKKLTVALTYVYDRIMQLPIDKNTLEIVGGFLSLNMFDARALEFARQGFERGTSKLGHAGSNELLRASFSLLTKLVSKGHGFDLALSIVREGRQPYVYQLLVALVEQGQGYSEAIRFAQDAMQAEPVFAYQSSAPLILFGLLVDRGQAYKEAIVAAQKAVENDKSKEQAFELFNKLIEKGQGFDEAISIARLGTKNKDAAIRAASYKLFDKLLEKNYRSDELISVAFSNTADENELVAFAGVQFMGKLIKEGKARDAAIALVSRARETNNQALIFNLMGAAVENRQGYDLAIELAREALKLGLETQASSQIAQAIDLLTKLVRKGQAIELAKEAVQKNANNANLYVQEAVDDLREALESKGEESP